MKVIWILAEIGLAVLMWNWFDKKLSALWDFIVGTGNLYVAWMWIKPFLTWQNVLSVIVAWLFFEEVVWPIWSRLWLMHKYSDKVAKQACSFGRVVKVVDGDTVDVRMGLFSLYRKKRVRLRYIDAPESDQRYGKHAQRFLSRRCNGKTVMLLSAKNPDKYGRLLGELYVMGLLGSKNLNLLMVQHGWAWAYQASKMYVEYERVARRKRVGLWRDRNPVNPSIHRKGGKDS